MDITTTSIICKQCGGGFAWNGTPRRKPRACSRECRKALLQAAQPPMTCLHCDEAFRPTAADRTTFCCREHAYAYRRAHGLNQKAACEDCGKAYRPNSGKQKWCLACRAKRIAARKTKQYSRTCEICGGDFTAGIITQRWCSNPACAMEGARRHGRRVEAEKHEPVPYTCAVCGKGAQARYGDKNRMYCSSVCKKVVKRQWDKNQKHKRRARMYGGHSEVVLADVVFNRDGWQCQACGDKVSRRRGVNHHLYPNLDHIVPLAKGGDHTYANTQCLCRACNITKGDSTTGQQLRLIG